MVDEPKSPYAQSLVAIYQGLLRLGWAPFTRRRLLREEERLKDLNRAWHEGLHAVENLTIQQAFQDSVSDVMGGPRGI